MAISFVAAGTTFNSTASGTSFTLNKPAGVASGDFMIAAIAFWASTGSQQTVTVPSGWTLLNTAFGSGSDYTQVSVMYRQAGASEPASWTASIASGSSLRAAGVVAYRGVQSILTSGIAGAGSVTSFSTATVNNTAANSWRVVAAAYVSASATYTISSNEVTREALFTADGGGSGAEQGAIWDSGGTIATGNTSRTVSRSAAWAAAAAVILIIQPTAGTAATGTMAMTCGQVIPILTGEVHNDAPLAMSLSPVSMSFDGTGSPVAGTGTMDMQLSPVSESFAGTSYTPVTGTMAMTVLPSVQISGETRTFGVRVITVDNDTSRRIIVQSRGVDD